MFSSIVFFSLNFREMLNCKMIPFHSSLSLPRPCHGRPVLFHYFFGSFGMLIYRFIHACLTVRLPSNFIHRRFSVSLGSDPRTIKCYGQGPTSSGSNDEIGMQTVNWSWFFQDWKLILLYFLNIFNILGNYWSVNYSRKHTSLLACCRFTVMVSRILPYVVSIHGNCYVYIDQYNTV